RAVLELVATCVAGGVLLLLPLRLRTLRAEPDRQKEVLQKSTLDPVAGLPVDDLPQQPQVNRAEHIPVAGDVADLDPHLSLGARGHGRDLAGDLAHSIGE